MHKRYGGQAVPKGSYWDFRNWKVVLVTQPGKALPGPDTQLYLQVNTFELVLCIALISISFVVFLPAIGFAMLLYTGSIAVMVFIIQKVLANIGRQECKAETCVCNFAKKRFCRHWGDDDLTMAVRGLFVSLIYLLGGITSRLLLC